MAQASATIWPLSFDRGRVGDLVAGFGRDQAVEVLHHPAAVDPVPADHHAVVVDCIREESAQVGDRIRSGTGQGGFPRLRPAARPVGSIWRPPPCVRSNSLSQVIGTRRVATARTLSMLVWGFGATIRRSGYRFIADGADRHKRWGPGPPGSRPRSVTGIARSRCGALDGCYGAGRAAGRSARG